MWEGTLYYGGTLIDPIKGDSPKQRTPGSIKDIFLGHAPLGNQLAHNFIVLCRDSRLSSFRGDFL